MADALFDVNGRRAVVAGGARGLGFALGSALAERGARVVLADVLGEEGRTAVGELPGAGHSFVHLDVTDEASVEQAVGVAADHLGGLDIVVNSAGVARTGPAMELSAEAFVTTQSVNLTGAFLLSRHAARRMQADGVAGRIIHLASVSSRVSNVHYAAYSSSKAGLAQLVKVLGREWAPLGITVNALGPAVTPTPLLADVQKDEATRQRNLAEIPMGRFGTPEDLYGGLILLASPAGAFITGQTLFIDGGRTLV